MASEAKLRANKKYLCKTDEFKVRVPLGRKEEIATFAKEVRGKSLNAYVVDLINADMKKEENGQ